MFLQQTGHCNLSEGTVKQSLLGVLERHSVVGEAVWMSQWAGCSGALHGCVFRRCIYYARILCVGIMRFSCILFALGSYNNPSTVESFFFFAKYVSRWSGFVSNGVV